MMDFIRGSIAGTTTEVPGIGPAAAKKLAAGEGDEAITNTYQLIGKVRRNTLVVFVLVCVKMGGSNSCLLSFYQLDLLNRALNNNNVIIKQ